MRSSSRRSPNNRLDSVQTGGYQGRKADDPDKHTGRMAANRAAGSIKSSLSYQPKAQGMNEHREYDQWDPPCPVAAPGGQLSVGD